MNRRYLIPVFGLALLFAVVLSGVLLISHPSVWNPMHKHVMDDDFQVRQNLKPQLVEMLFDDAEKISGGLWNETPYTEISANLKFRKMNQKELHHYEDVRSLIQIAKWAIGASLLIAIIGFFLVGWRKVWNASVASFVLLGVVAGVWMAIYWRGLFRALHWVIFQDDSWILPSKSYSLGLFPHKVWQMAGGMIAAYVFLILGIGVMIQVLRKSSRKS